MYSGIAPNGGGNKVNKYTLIYDVMIAPAGPGAASMIQIDDPNNTSDGDLFWQGNNSGQGANGYNGTSIFTPGAWHRVAIAVDLTQNPGVITKFVDGVKQDDWKPGDRLDGRRALQEFSILFGDGNQDERRVWYVNSIQVRDGKLSDDALIALGGPEAGGIPIVLNAEEPPLGQAPLLTITRSPGAVLSPGHLSWQGLCLKRQQIFQIRSGHQWQA